MKANLGMYYTIYKIINKINNKTYIGKHQTKNLNDSYMGSGKLLRRAIAKHGIENFEKHILFIFDNEAEMNAKEKELVILCESSYNLCGGGKGGFGYINRTSEIVQKRVVTLQKKYAEDTELKARFKKSCVERYNKYSEDYKDKLANLRLIGIKRAFIERGNKGTFSGKTHTDETKKKMRTKGKKIIIDGVEFSSLSEARAKTGFCFYKLKRLNTYERSCD